MKRILILLTAVFLFSNISFGQSEEEAVKATIDQLFTAMRQTDPIKLKDAFGENAILQTISRKQDGSFFVRDEKINDFAEQISKAKKDSLDERIVYETIKIDGPLAIVWTPYKFYYAGNFSHCGVNSFQLVKAEGKWKIQYLIDTRRRQGCE